MTDTLDTLSTKIRDNYLAVLATNTTPDYDAEAKVAVGWGGDVGRGVMVSAIAAGLLVVDPYDERDTYDACWKIADEVKIILAERVSPDRIRAAQEATR